MQDLERTHDRRCWPSNFVTFKVFSTLILLVVWAVTVESWLFFTNLIEPPVFRNCIRHDNGGRSSYNKRTLCYRPKLQFIMPLLYAVLLCLLAFATASLSTRQEPLSNAISDSPPDGTIITQITNSGNGCPRNTLNITTNPDLSIVASKLSSFQVSLGPNISPTEKSKNCAIHISLTYPPGWQFMLVQSSFSGFAKVDQGVGGHFYTQYFVSSNAGNTVSLFLCSFSLCFVILSPTLLSMISISSYPIFVSILSLCLTCVHFSPLLQCPPPSF